MNACPKVNPQNKNKAHANLLYKFVSFGKNGGYKEWRVM
jgi:hypothetical protein